MNRLYLLVVKYKVKSSLEKGIFLVLKVNRIEKKLHHAFCLKKERKKKHRYLCKLNLRASNGKKTQKLS